MGSGGGGLSAEDAAFEDMLGGMGLGGSGSAGGAQGMD